MSDTLSPYIRVKTSRRRGS